MPPRACHATLRCSRSRGSRRSLAGVTRRMRTWCSRRPRARSTTCSSQRGLPLPVLETLPKTTKLTYEVCHGRSGSNSRLLSPLRLAARAALLDAHVFFLPCDAQTRDYLDEADLRDRARKRLGAVAAPRGACARARHRWLCHAVWQPVCLIGSCTGVPWPVWACAEARWSGDASPVDAPSRCVALCTVRGSQTRADRSIPV